MVQWVIADRVDLSKDAQRQQVGAPEALMLPGDNEAHRWEITVLNNGETADLTGASVTGYFLRSDGETVAVVGSVTGNVISVVLAQECYAVEGLMRAIVRVTLNGVITTVIQRLFRVQQDIGDQIIDPGEVIPGIDELLARIAAMEAATAAANAAAAAVPDMIAPTFSASTAYAAGDYVYYDGALYRFTVAHAAGVWTGSDAVEVKLAGEVGELKNDLYGEDADASGGLLVNGYYIKNDKQVTASANFNTYKYSLSGVKYVEITTYGYNSTASVASNSDYNDSSLPGKTFTNDDKMIYPSTTIGSISAWTEKAIVDGYDYLYVSCYKNNTPSVLFYSGNGALPISLGNSIDIDTLKTKELSAVESYGVLLNSADRWSAFSNNANNLTPNRIYCITYSTDIANLPYSGFNGFIRSYMAYYGNSTVWMQAATNSTGKRNFSRVLWSGTWTEWQEFALASDLSLYGDDIHTLFYENDLWKVFHTVGVIGDSLASGESASNEGGSTQYHDLYTFSWGQCMARDSGNTYYNFSKGGLTTKTWMTDPDYGYALASQPDKLCDMYIIGLGQNDAGQSMTVGTSADIDFSNPDNNADTFYGNYAKIIQKMQAIAPKAPIFVCSRPTVPASNAYESAIRAMPTLFDNVYLLDMYKHVHAYYDADGIIRKCLRSGHYNAIGYQVMSKHIEEEISNVIKANLNDFLQVEFINTNWSWTDQ